MTTYVGLKKQLIKEGAKQHVPVVGEFELTGLCNLKCTMCYVRKDLAKDELDTATWKKIFQEAADQGMLYALLTGGEVLMRKDFKELYNFLFDLGVKITLFTNATMISDDVIDTLKQRPPELIGVTLYGANNSTYFAVTKDPIGFDKVHRGISKLKEVGLPLILRTLPLRVLHEQVDQLIAYAKSMDLMLGYSLYVGPNRYSKEWTEERLNARELVEFEDAFKKAFEIDLMQEFSKSENGFTCAALRSAFFITYNGNMQPCAMLSVPKKSVLQDGFTNVWKEFEEIVKQIPSCRDCNGCSVQTDCIVCMAKLYLEGDFSTCSPYLKALATERKKKRYGEV